MLRAVLERTLARAAEVVVAGIDLLDEMEVGDAAEVRARAQEEAAGALHVLEVEVVPKPQERGVDHLDRDILLVIIEANSLISFICIPGFWYTTALISVAARRTFSVSPRMMDLTCARSMYPSARLVFSCGSTAVLSRTSRSSTASQNSL